MQDSLKSDRRANGRWTQEQHLIFLQGLRVYGKNWKKIQQLIQTRTGAQIRSHAQKFFLKVDNGGGKNKEASQEEQQSQNQSSKALNQDEAMRQSSSYFLNKILEHSTGFGVTNFWSALVDWKYQFDSKEQKHTKHSFGLYGKQIQNNARIGYS